MVVGRIRLGCFHTNRVGDTLGEVVADAVQLDDDVIADDGALDIRVLETHRVHDELLLSGHQRIPEQARLRPDVLKGRADGTEQLSARCATGRGEESVANGLIRLLRGAVVERVGRVGVGVQGDEHLACAIAVVVVNWNLGPVDGQLLEVGAAISVELSVQVGEEAALKQGILSEVDTANNVAGLELDLSAFA